MRSGTTRDSFSGQFFFLFFFFVFFWFCFEIIGIALLLLIVN